MSWGIWKKLKAGVGKAVGFVKNLLGRTPKAVKKVSKTVGKIANRVTDTVSDIAGNVGRMANKARRFVNGDDDYSDNDNDSDVEEDVVEPIPKRRKNKLPLRESSRRIIPETRDNNWRKMLVNTSDDDNEPIDSPYAVSYGGRNWKPRMKSQPQLMMNTRRPINGRAKINPRSRIDLSDDLSE